MIKKLIPVTLAFLGGGADLHAEEVIWPPLPAEEKGAIAAYLPRTGTLALAAEAYAELGDLTEFIAAPTAQDIGAFPLFEAKDFALPFTLVIRTGNGASVQQKDSLVFRFRNLLTGRTSSVRRPVETAIGVGERKEVLVTITNRDVRLGPGAYQVSVDVEVGGRTLCGETKGSCELYLQKPGESRRHILAIYMLGFTAYFRDYEFGGYFSNFQPQLPPTYDPLDADSRHAFLRHFVKQTQKWAELLNYTGIGLIAASEGHEALKEKRAADFAEEAVAGLCDYIVSMETEFGPFTVTSDPVHDKWPDLPKPNPPWSFYDTDQDGCYLEVLGPAVLRFKGHRQYRGRVAQWMSACVKSLEWLRTAGWDENPPQGCNLRRFWAPEAPAEVWTKNRGPFLERPQCTVYDGRVVAGFGWACAAYHSVYEQVPESFLSRLKQATRTAATWTESHQGIYDPFCAQQGDNHHELLGNSYMMHGLLAAAVVAKAVGDDEWLEEMRRGQELLLGHLNECTRQRDKKRAVWSFSSWSSGELYYVVEEWGRRIGSLPTAELVLNETFRPHEVNCLRQPFNVKCHGTAMLVEFLFSCDEYRKARR